MERILINSFHSTSHINKLKQIHVHIIKSFPDILSSYAKRLITLSFIDYARKVFDHIPLPDPSVYDSFICAYSRLSFNKEAVQQFVSLRCTHTSVSCYSIPPILRTCSSLLAKHLGEQIHCLAIHSGLESNVFVQSSLIDFYAKVGNLNCAKKVFDEILVKDPVCYNCLITGFSKAGDVLTARNLFDEMKEKNLISWNAMLSCYAHNGDFLEGFRIFEQMQAEHFRPNEFSVVTVLSICAKLGNLDFGLRVKKFIDDRNIKCNMIVSTALLEMYVKCGLVDEARQEFDQMEERDVVSWGAMIVGYAQNGRSSEALKLFECMSSEGIKPTNVILVGVLSACAQLGSVETGERIGNYVESLGLESNAYLSSALVGMYSKCGNIAKARQVFEKMPSKDFVTWNSMITGFAVNGLAEEAIAIYTKMKETGIKPNEITFVGLLTACVHAGLLELGLKFFQSLQSEYGILPKLEHYSCLVDLFCRAGRLKEAYEFICKMDVKPNAVIWGILLSACRIQLNIELAEILVHKLLELEPENSGHYVLLANIYASLGRWQDARKVWSLMKNMRLQKTPAYSWIELENKMHKFLVADISHPQSENIFGTIDDLTMHTTWVAYDFESELEFS